MRYVGWYTYNEKKENTEFEVKKYETNFISGEGKDVGGAFSMEIKIKKSCFVTMKKVYHGSNSVKIIFILILGKLLWKMY